MKVLVSDNLSEVGVQILREADGIEVDVNVGLAPEELESIIGQYHGLAIRGATKVTSKILEAADNLKVVGRAGTGLDNVDIPFASKRGIVVMNTPGGNSVTTAEHTLTMLLCLARNIPQAHASMKHGKWEKKKFGGAEVFNKTLGVVGLGQIGKIVADRAMGLGMNVIGYDPFLSADQAKQLGINKMDLEEVFKRSDFITFHVPLTDETKGIVNSANIAKMKDGVRIINCARGPVVNENDLAEALRSGKVAGAALDVYPVEPPVDNPLIEMENVICTPHLGASTREAQENVAIAVANQIKDYLLHGTVRNAVNAPAVSGEALNTLRPYLDLAERLGLFLGQMVETGARSIEAQYAGEVTDMDLGPITISFLTGFLRPIMGMDVNQVNASMVAEERGVALSETKFSKGENFLSVLRYKVTTDKQDFLVEGALFGLTEPRMVRFNSAKGEFDLSGNLLLIRGMDKPGVIGRVGSTLGDADINISHFQFAREAAGGAALLFLNTDSRPDDETVEKLKTLDSVSSVRRIVI